MYEITVTKANGQTATYKACSSCRAITFSQVGYCFILRHTDHAFLQRFYHGPNGIRIGSPKYKEICALEKEYAHKPLHALLHCKIEEHYLDGRSRRAKALRFFTVDNLI